MQRLQGAGEIEETLSIQEKQLLHVHSKALLAAQVCPNRRLTQLTTKTVLEQVICDWVHVTQPDLVANCNRPHEEWDPSCLFTNLAELVHNVEESATD